MLTAVVVRSKPIEFAYRYTHNQRSLPRAPPRDSSLRSTIEVCCPQRRKGTCKFMVGVRLQYSYGSSRTERLSTVHSLLPAPCLLHLSLLALPQQPPRGTPCALHAQNCTHTDSLSGRTAPSCQQRKMATVVPMPLALVCFLCGSALFASV